jgi:hypothetical protein
LADVPTENIDWYISGKDFKDDFSGGFNSVTVSDSGLVSTFWDQDGGEMYTTATYPPRARAAAAKAAAQKKN